MQPIQVKIQDIKNPINFPKKRKLIVINKHNGSIGNIDSIIISKQEKTGANTPIDSKKFWTISTNLLIIYTPIY